MTGRLENPHTLLWLVIVLSLPTHAAFLIVVTATLYPNTTAYLLIPLALFAPLSFLGAAFFTVQMRHSTPRLFRVACIVLTCTLLLGVATITVIRTS